MKRFNSMIIFCAVSLCFSSPLEAKTFLDKHYKKVELSQSNGSYLKTLRNLSGDNEAMEEIYNDLLNLFNELKDLPANERTSHFEDILFYWSHANQRFKPSALKLDEQIGYSISNLQKGNFDPESITKSLISTITTFESNLISPLLGQVEAELKQDHSGKIILYLGRDFTPAFVYSSVTQNLKGSKLVNLNISRAVKDLVFSGKSKQLRELLAANGITAKSVRSRGLVILDSSMKGKIPKAILYALTENISDEHALDIITNKTAIRYIKSKTTKAGSITDQAKELMQAYGNFSPSVRSVLLDENKPITIPRLSVKVPSAYRGYGNDSNHHFFEHKFKPVTTAQRFSRSYDWALRGDHPSSIPDKIKSLLGFIADIQLYRITSGLPVIDPKSLGPSAIDKKSSIGAAKVRQNSRVSTEKMNHHFETLNEIHQSNIGNEENTYLNLRHWQDNPTPKMISRHAKLRLVAVNDGKHAFELFYNDKLIFQLKKFLSQGRNGLVFLTSSNTALKLAKEPQNATRNVLQAWMAEELEAYNMNHARILSADKDGLYIEMEYIPGEELQYSYAFNGKELPSEIKQQVRSEWDKAYHIAKKENLWIDFKAANYHVTKDGLITLVDYAPRLNKGRKRYFLDKSNHKLSEIAMYDEFLNHEIRKGNAKKIPGQKCQFIFQGIQH